MRLSATDRSSRALAAPPDASGPGRWGWRFVWDAIVLYAIYDLYELVRAKVSGSTSAAYHNAMHVVALERALHVYWEHGFQQRLIAHTRVLQFWDIYYGTVHFCVPVVVLVLLYHWWPDGYRRWRNTLGWTVGIALVSFAVYPLMPPRLLPSSFGFVDTAARFGGLGALDRGSLRDVENLYAAMPSLHIAWSTWSACALAPVVRRKWVKVLLFGYPFLTMVSIVVTANHWILDAFGGVVALGLGYMVATTWETRWEMRRSGSVAAVAPAAVRRAVVGRAPAAAPVVPSASAAPSATAPVLAGPGPAAEAPTAVASVPTSPAAAAVVAPPTATAPGTATSATAPAAPAPPARAAPATTPASTGATPPGTLRPSAGG